MGQKSLRRKSKFTVILETRRFDNIDSGVVIGSVSKAVKNCNMMTADVATSRFYELLWLYFSSFSFYVIAFQSASMI